MRPRVRARLWYLALASVTIGLGLIVHLRGTALSTIARDVLGDALWAAMIVWCVSFIVPTAPRMKRGAVALAVCWVVEASQLYHGPSIDAVRATTAGRLVFGTGFDPRDLAAYAVGVVVAILLDAGIRTGTQSIQHQ
jgi:hypothetical protein